MIEFDNLCVRRGPRIILRDSSLSFLGGIVGLIAPNGSGKTTLLETLAVPWDRRVSGRLLVDGVATTPGEWERYCFYLPSAAKLLEPLLTGREHAQIARRQWRSDASIEKIAHACGASGIIDTPVRKCSDGMRQLIALTVAMSTGTRLLLLDEPLSALDPTNKERATRALAKWAATGRTVVMSTHDLGIADSFCTAAVFVREGQLATVSGKDLDGTSCQRLYREFYEERRS